MPCCWRIPVTDSACRRILTAPLPQFSDTTLLAAVARVSGKTKVESTEVLTDYDSYYYPRHHQSLVEKPLPVVLVTMADDTGTRFYLDPQDGKLIAKLDRSGRVLRWFYSALHHWDFGWLYYRPIWDAWMLTWVSLGLVLGVKFPCGGLAAAEANVQP